MPSVAVTTIEILKNHRQWSFYERNIKKITGSKFSMHVCFIALSTVLLYGEHLTRVWFQDIDCAIEKKYYIVMWHLTENSKFSTAYSPYTPRKRYTTSSPNGFYRLVRRKKKMAAQDLARCPHSPPSTTNMLSFQFCTKNTTKLR